MNVLLTTLSLVKTRSPAAPLFQKALQGGAGAKNRPSTPQAPDVSVSCLLVYHKAVVLTTKILRA